MANNSQIKHIQITRGGKSKYYKTLSAVAEFFNVSKYAVTSAHDRCDTINGYKVFIHRKDTNDCLECGKQLVNTDDDFCNTCYYKELTGKSLSESSFIMGKDVDPRVRS